MNTTKCIICNAITPDMEGPVSEQTYLPQSPGCWKLYTEVLAREYGEWKHPPIHRLTVDSYAAQHPTLEPNKKSTQSVTVHLVGIYLFLERNMDPKDITKKIGEIIKRNKGNFKLLNSPDNLGNTTIANVHKANSLDEHVLLVRKWAETVWEAWIEYHEYIKEIAEFKE